MFKIVNGSEDVDRDMFFKLKEGSRTTGHKAALIKEQCRLDMRKYYFSLRVINEWNKLPNDYVNASSVNMFKNRIDRYLIRAGYTANGFGFVLASVASSSQIPSVSSSLIYGLDF